MVKGGNFLCEKRTTRTESHEKMNGKLIMHPNQGKMTRYVLSEIPILIIGKYDS
jgi:hypothetical protein